MWLTLQGAFKEDYGRSFHYVMWRSIESCHIYMYVTQLVGVYLIVSLMSVVHVHVLSEGTFTHNMVESVAHITRCFQRNIMGEAF